VNVSDCQSIVVHELSNIYYDRYPPVPTASAAALRRICSAMKGSSGLLQEVADTLNGAAARFSAVAKVEHKPGIPQGFATKASGTEVVGSHEFLNIT